MRWLLLPFGIALGLYLPAAFGTDWILDDRWLLQPGHGGLVELWTPGASDKFTWRPLASTLQTLVAWVFGNDPRTYRLLNLGLHLLNLAGVTACARAMGASWRGVALAATSWTVHPALPDVIAYNSAAFDLLATTLLLGAAWTCLAAPGVAAWATGPFVFAALLAKETVAPLAILAPALLAWRGQRRAAGFAALGSAVALGAWGAWHLHVTGDPALGAQLGADAIVAWLQTLPWLGFLPAQAGMTHLFDPGDDGRTLIGVAFLLVGLVARGSRPVLLGFVSWGLLLVPVGPGLPLIGLQPFRYAYLPSAFAYTCFAAVTVPARYTRYVGFALAGWILLQLPRASARIDDWREENALWESEMGAELTNPATLYYAGSFHIRHSHSVGEVRAGLDLWERAVNDPPPRTIQAFDPVEHRYALAQAAFLAGSPKMALRNVETYLAARPDAPANAWCLLADCRQQLRQPVTPEVEARCSGG